MDNLRLILILIGLVVLALIILFHKPAGESRRNHARWRMSRREPHIGNDGSVVDDDEDRTEPSIETASLWDGGHGAQRFASPASDAPQTGADASEQQARETPDKIVYLYICRRDERRINGSELLDAAIKAGLNFGEMNIFHRLHEGESKPVFSMANLTEPGHFDPSAWNVFDTPGVTLFMTLPAPVSALDAWDAMLATASRISELLEADVLDDSQCLLTRQRIAQVREEMREYDRRSGLIKSS